MTSFRALRIRSVSCSFRTNTRYSPLCLGKRFATSNAQLSDVTTGSNTPINIDSTVTETAMPAFLEVNEHALIAMHDLFGLSWASTIVLGTLALRSAITLPLAIYQQRIMATMIELSPILNSWAETLKVSVAKQVKGDYKGYQKELNCQYRAKVKQIYAQNGCSRWKLFTLPYVQIPLFISMTLTVRDLLGMPLPWLGRLRESPFAGLNHEGFGPWIDLTAADATMVFPFLIGAGNLINVEVHHNGYTCGSYQLTYFLLCSRLSS
ncbi:hypothetical protein DM01DRAFT_1397079 [Hesseltinella vesiculosa]|uniref:Mitochondrial inner membrane protein COX18 n=1 Tax=Hesseltinella vesiculosa TaxID=101127 RepID=A0A1X2G6L4_9FUNG|nr:hypothetical protein DM01DRAFT_1397079 [Hesseltinella vesiculosa]